MFIKFTADAFYDQGGPPNDRRYEAGKTYEVTDDHGRRWLRRQVAEEVESPKAAKETKTDKTDDKPKAK
jgi:hypothetical protein